MRTSHPSHRRSERGQILVIVAGGLIGLLAIVAFALEGGTLVLNRRDAQNAADLASLAGTRTVAVGHTGTPKTQADVYATVEGSLDSNDCHASSGTPCAWTAHFVGAGLTDLGAVSQTAAAIPGSALGVRVGVTRQPGANLGRILGFDHWTVTSEATAIAAEPSQFPAGILLPIALCGWGQTGVNACQQASDAPPNVIDFQPGQIYDLTDGKDAPGGFGWLSWTGSNSATALSDSICQPDNIPFSLDSAVDDPGSYGGVIGTNPATGETWFPVDPGKSNKSSMRACLDGWISSKATVLIPVYDLVTGNGNGAAYHITGVAAFVLTSREQPAVDNIQGYFVQYYPYTDVPGGLGTQPPGPDDTTYFLGLVR
jgi:Putative Flp pilus-assembly TadE/G-like